MGPEKTLDLCAAEKFGGVFRLKTTIPRFTSRVVLISMMESKITMEVVFVFCAAGKFLICSFG